MRKSGKKLCSDSSADDDDDVYYDAPEEPNDVSTTSRETRRKKQAENKSNKVQAPMNSYHYKPPSSRWKTGSNNGTSKQPRNAPSHPRETGFNYKKDIPDSPIGTRTRAGVFHFGDGGPTSSTTSERDTTRPSALGTRPPTIEARPSTSAFRLHSSIPEMGHQYKDGIADNKIEKLATSLMDIDIKSVICFGRELGLKDVRKYCGYGYKPSHKSKILLMLQDWKGRTPEAQQVQGLLQALKNAHLEQLAGNLHLQDAQTSFPKNVTCNSKPTSKLEERKIKPFTFSSSFSVWMQTRSSKPVIYICTSYGLHGIKGLTEMVQNSVKQSYSSCEIKETELPYIGLDDFKFPSEASKRDAMILCHSVNNRGFSITDVPNSLYNVFLKYCNQLFGKDRVAVIVHDFIGSQEILDIHLQQFERSQPTAYELVGFVALAGDLNTSDAKLCYYPRSRGLDSFVRKLR